MRPAIFTVPVSESSPSIFPGDIRCKFTRHGMHTDASMHTTANRLKEKYTFSEKKGNEREYGSKMPSNFIPGDTKQWTVKWVSIMTTVVKSTFLLSVWLVYDLSRNCGLRKIKRLFWDTRIVYLQQRSRLYWATFCFLTRNRRIVFRNLIYKDICETETSLSSCDTIPWLDRIGVPELECQPFLRFLSSFVETTYSAQ